MAWETRGDRRYYYRVYKVKGRVRKEYLGNGPLAELAARRDDRARKVRRDGEVIRRRKHNAMQAIDAPIDAFTDALETLTRATLLSAGYHRLHGSEWRRRRHA